MYVWWQELDDIIPDLSTLEENKSLALDIVHIMDNMFIINAYWPHQVIPFYFHL